MSDTAFVRREESDPNGIGQHAPGAKLDAGKVRAGLVLFGFAHSLEQVARVGTYGAEKYSDNGWMQVPDGVRRYTDALLRHLLAEAMGERIDPETGLPHAAHCAWNALARLDPARSSRSPPPPASCDQSQIRARHGPGLRQRTFRQEPLPERAHWHPRPLP